MRKIGQIEEVYGLTITKRKATGRECTRSHRMAAKRLQPEIGWKRENREKLADGLLIHKNNSIHICNRQDFCQYHLNF
jgi:hypothetical protein